MIGIRADANETIASGHIMRCIAIAEQIKNRGESVIFITADHFSDALLDEKECKHVCLNSDWKEKNKELDILESCIREWSITTLLVDSYEVTMEYQKTLHQFVKIAYIDDLCLFSYPVDILINYAIDADKTAYTGMDNGTVQMLLGADYIPIRKEFEDKKIQIKPKVKNVMVTTGGSDHYHISYLLTERISKMNQWKDINFHFIIGGFFDYEENEALESISNLNQNIVLHKNVKNMAEIMAVCDLAVSASGTTIAELCACGLPTVCFVIADNQLAGARAFERHGAVVFAGDIRENLNAGIDGIIESIECMRNNQEIREQYSNLASKLIDGKGASRIAAHLLGSN
jgi:UDP-2,4-diacetamido-2,4,6-trideoxy-beta-L-altropyranose hydrolase